jgi:hypothetical protein
MPRLNVYSCNIHLVGKNDPAPHIERIPLPSIGATYAAAQDKLNRRPVSTDRRGFIKCSGKWSAHKVAAVRFANLKAAQS